MSDYFGTAPEGRRIEYHDEVPAATESHCPTCGQPVPTCSNCRTHEAMVMAVDRDGSPIWRCLGCGHWFPDLVEATTGEMDKGWPARPQARA